MPTDVYLLCPKCKGITDGKGNGDIPKDRINCDKCGENITAIMVGNLSQTVNEEDKKWLYIEESMISFL